MASRPSRSPVLLNVVARKAERMAGVGTRHYLALVGLLQVVRNGVEDT